MDDEELAFSMVNGLAGRLYLSGRPDLLDQHQFALVAEAVQTYRDVRADYPAAVPFWPLGPPGWHDPWVALGLDAPAATYLFVWRRGGDTDTCALQVRPLAGASTEPTCLYPASLPTQLAWDPAASTLTVTVTARYSARLLRFARP
jgi:alpha-galactosidase